MLKFKFFVLFSVVNGGLLFAQGERATISGTVTDSTGAVVPQVRVSVRNERTNIVNKAESNSTGLYVVPALNLVVAVTAGLYTANRGSPAPESLAGDTALNSFVLPATLGR